MFVLCNLQIKIVCDSYLTYLQGLDAAKNLLSELKGYPEFNMFLQVGSYLRFSTAVHLH